jgi:predicted DNA-binding WGR domain protein
MSAYELYRCIREDGTSKDWAVRINPDGTVTTRWGRTGRKLINIQTRNVDPETLKRSKAKKGYIRVGHFDIDVLGDLIPER